MFASNHEEIRDISALKAFALISVYWFHSHLNTQEINLQLGSLPYIGGVFEELMTPKCALLLLSIGSIKEYIKDIVYTQLSVGPAHSQAAK